MMKMQNLEKRVQIVKTIRKGKQDEKKYINKKPSKEVVEELGFTY